MERARGRSGRALPHRGLRRIRTAALASLGLTVALLAHVLQGGGIPALEPLALMGVAAGLLMFPLVGRQLNPARTAVHLITLQVVVHLLANAFAGAHSLHSGPTACATYTATSVAWHAAAVIVLALALVHLESLALRLLCLLFGCWLIARAIFVQHFAIPRLVAGAFDAVQLTRPLPFVGTSLNWRGPPLTA